MSKLFSCDRCHKEFGGPLDEERFANENGVLKTYDLCAPCRKMLADVQNEAKRKFFKDINNG